MSAYMRGHLSGYADALCDYRSEYAWNILYDRNAYSREYSQGYRDGWREMMLAKEKGATS
jgi:hypothetical protein